ncbi:hypothetical protein B0H16DRAFT_1751586 [Mycena metata]|uniref:Uncharacterized protein n=1 Tax=Mycena metata TaxID=1033252 RepID=A0AAD7GLD2_9AGAR|nr:hypothetical protein B0H16DRAFT_1751586 [Mycena metata]
MKTSKLRFPQWIDQTIAFYTAPIPCLDLRLPKPSTRFEYPSNTSASETIGPSSHGITAKAPRPKRADVKSTAAQLAATKRYRQANLLALREKAWARVARRRQEVKGTESEEALKASARLNHARFRERNQAELAHRQRTRRAQADRLNFHAQKRAATVQRQLDDDLAEAEEEAEWAARQLEQAQGAPGLSYSTIDTGAGDDDD